MTLLNFSMVNIYRSRRRGGSSKTTGKYKMNKSNCNFTGSSRGSSGGSPVGSSGSFNEALNPSKFKKNEDGKNMDLMTP